MKIIKRCGLCPAVISIPHAKERLLTTNHYCNKYNIKLFRLNVFHNNCFPKKCKLEGINDIK